MRIAHALLTITVISLAVFTSPARAQMEDASMGHAPRIFSIGLGGGVSVPMSDAKDAFKNGFVGHGFARLNLRLLPIAPRVDFTYSKFDVASAKLATPGASGTGQMLAGMVNLQYYLIPRGPIRPYIVAGVGAYNVKTDLTGVPGATSQSDTRFGVNGGGGVVFRLGSLLSAFIEGRLDNVYSKQGFIAADQIQVVPVTFGVVF